MLKRKARAVLGGLAPITYKCTISNKYQTTLENIAQVKPHH